MKLPGPTRHQHALWPTASIHAVPPIPTGRGTNHDPRRPTEAQPAVSRAIMASRGRPLGFLRLRPGWYHCGPGAGKSRAEVEAVEGNSMTCL